MITSLSQAHQPSADLADLPAGGAGGTGGVDDHRGAARSGHVQRQFAHGVDIFGDRAGQAHVHLPLGGADGVCGGAGGRAQPVLGEVVGMDVYARQAVVDADARTRDAAGERGFDRPGVVGNRARARVLKEQFRKIAAGAQCLTKRLAREVAD